MITANGSDVGAIKRCSSTKTRLLFLAHWLVDGKDVGRIPKWQLGQWRGEDGQLTFDLASRPVNTNNIGIIISRSFLQNRIQSVGSSLLMSKMKKKIRGKKGK